MFTINVHSQAVAAALLKLATIADSYDGIDAQCPGCGGFIPWIGVSDTGFAVVKNKTSIPGLDNGQLAWSFVAVVEALRIHAGAGATDALLARYTARVEKMRLNRPILFVKHDPAFPGQLGRVGSSAKILNVDAAPSSENVKTTGSLGDPFEGELLIYFLELMGDNSTGLLDSRQLWFGVHRSVGPLWNHYNGRDYNGRNNDGAGLTDGPITVQKGWYF